MARALRLFLVALLFLLQSCLWRDAETVEIYGNTMGTRYSVQIPASEALPSVESLKREIDNTLDRVNLAASTYRGDSDLSRFNAADVDHWVSVSAELLDIVIEAKKIHEWTNGTFDPSIGPLVNLWGFGPSEALGVPDSEQVEEVQALVGLSKLSTRDSPTPALKKTVDGFHLDLSAIAKGYAVDRIATLLDEMGIKHYLVEVGGEIRAQGNNAAGEVWRIAVEEPGAGSTATHRIIPLSDRAVATSGSYRNFFEVDGRRYTHIIDPVSGRPVQHALMSVTVLAKTTMRADALATALLVMGPDKGPAWASQENISAYFISGDSGAVVRQSTGILSELE